MNRRDWLRSSGLIAGGWLVAQPGHAGHAGVFSKRDSRPFRFCLNMSTIRGQELSAEAEVDVAAKAGYDAVEPWMGKLHAAGEKSGGIKELHKRITDHGLSVESAIGFAKWIVDDESTRQAGLEQARRDMEVLARIGGKRIAAPPAGAPWNEPIDPMKAAERYHRLLELGDKIGVTPQVEVWGGNATIGKLSQAISIAIEAGHPKACFLGDVYHCYKGGSDFDGLALLGPRALQVFHLNDYPEDPPREEIGDEDRVYPGDGIAPLERILEIFRSVEARPVLSLELFNKRYWQQDPLEVAKTGLSKMKRVTGSAEDQK